MNYHCLSFIDGEVEIIDRLSTAAQGLTTSQVWSLCLKASITSLVHGMACLNSQLSDLEVERRPPVKNVQMAKDKETDLKEVVLEWGPGERAGR